MCAAKPAFKFYTFDVSKEIVNKNHPSLGKAAEVYTASKAGKKAAGKKVSKK